MDIFSIFKSSNKLAALEDLRVSTSPRRCPRAFCYYLLTFSLLTAIYYFMVRHRTRGERLNDSQCLNTSDNLIIQHITTSINARRATGMMFGLLCHRVAAVAAVQREGRHEHHTAPRHFRRDAGRTVRRRAASAAVFGSDTFPHSRSGPRFCWVCGPHTVHRFPILPPAHRPTFTYPHIHATPPATPFTRTTLAALPFLIFYHALRAHSTLPVVLFVLTRTRRQQNRAARVHLPTPQHLDVPRGADKRVALSRKTYFTT